MIFLMLMVNFSLQDLSIAVLHICRLLGFLYFVLYTTNYGKDSMGKFNYSPFLVPKQRSIFRSTCDVLFAAI